MAKGQITLKSWLTGSIEQRTDWLQSGAQLTERGGQILAEVMVLRDAGASIPDHIIVKAYPNA